MLHRYSSEQLKDRNSNKRGFLKTSLLQNLDAFTLQKLPWSIIKKIQKLRNIGVKCTGKQYRKIQRV